MPEIKALLPNAKNVMVEEDVTYLGYQRKYETFKTSQWKRLYETLKKATLTKRSCSPPIAHTGFDDSVNTHFEKSAVPSRSTSTGNKS